MRYSRKRFAEKIRWTGYSPFIWAFIDETAFVERALRRKTAFAHLAIRHARRMAMYVYDVRLL